MPPNTPGPPERATPRHGFAAWFVFVLAITAVLAVAGGCMAVIYAPVFAG